MWSTAIPLIAKYEGLELSPYFCPAFVLTIGYGHLIRRNKKYGKVQGARIIEVAETLRAMHGKNRASLNKALKNIFNDIISVDEAQEQLKTHAQYKWEQIHNTLPKGLTDNQCAAIISLTYNIGIKGFLNSTVKIMINAGNMQGAGQAFLRFDKARVNGVLRTLPGLSRRRQEEMEIFLK